MKSEKKVCYEKRNNLRRRRRRRFNSHWQHFLLLFCVLLNTFLLYEGKNSKKDRYSRRNREREKVFNSTNGCWIPCTHLMMKWDEGKRQRYIVQHSSAEALVESRESSVRLVCLFEKKKGGFHDYFWAIFSLVCLSVFLCFTCVKGERERVTRKERHSKKEKTPDITQEDRTTIIPFFHSLLCYHIGTLDPHLSPVFHILLFNVINSLFTWKVSNLCPLCVCVCLCAFRVLHSVSSQLLTHLSTSSGIRSRLGQGNLDGIPSSCEDVFGILWVWRSSWKTSIPSLHARITCSHQGKSRTERSQTDSSRGASGEFFLHDDLWMRMAENDVVGNVWGRLKTILNNEHQHINVKFECLNLFSE